MFVFQKEMFEDLVKEAYNKMYYVRKRREIYGFELQLHISCFKRDTGR